MPRRGNTFHIDGTYGRPSQPEHPPNSSGVWALTDRTHTPQPRLSHLEELNPFDGELLADLLLEGDQTWSRPLPRNRANPSLEHTRSRIRGRQLEELFVAHQILQERLADTPTDLLARNRLICAIERSEDEILREPIRHLDLDVA